MPYRNKRFKTDDGLRFSSNFRHDDRDSRYQRDSRDYSPPRQRSSSRYYQRGIQLQLLDGNHLRLTVLQYSTFTRRRSAFATFDSTRAPDIPILLLFQHLKPSESQPEIIFPVVYQPDILSLFVIEFHSRHCSLIDLVFLFKSIQMSLMKIETL